MTEEKKENLVKKLDIPRGNDEMSIFRQTSNLLIKDFLSLQ